SSTGSPPVHHVFSGCLSDCLLLWRPGPGFMVLALSTVVGTAWVDPFGHSPISLYATSAMLFLLVAGMIVVVVDRLSTAHEKLTRQEKQLEMINLELKHRIKNLFAIAD